MNLFTGTIEASVPSPKELAKQKLEERIKNDFTYHKPSPNDVETFDFIRNAAKDYALELVNKVPNSRELSIALGKLEEVVFYANAAVARNQSKEGSFEIPTPEKETKSFSYHGAPVAEQVSLTRKDIVKQAKNDINGLRDRSIFSRGEYVVNNTLSCNLEYIVDREKRTVVALMRGVNTRKIRARGVAKADPKDVFNEYIGKAIALRRAIGKEVPEEYYNAPSPIGFEVGDRVTFKNCGELQWNEVYEVVKKSRNLAGEKTLEDMDGTYLREGSAIIVDDSNRKY